MKQFVYIPQRLANTWLKYLHNRKYGNWVTLVDIAKIWALGGWLLLGFFVYVWFINLSSTLWYFLRQENNGFNDKKFDYEVSKTHILEKTQENWNSMYGKNNKIFVVNIHPQIVKTNEKSSLAVHSSFDK